MENFITDTLNRAINVKVTEADKKEELINNNNNISTSGNPNNQNEELLDLTSASMAGVVVKGIKETLKHFCVIIICACIV